MVSDGVDQFESRTRRDRAGVAAQACQRCRQRKSKCDEQRPRCTNCRRNDAECQYREPIPTKKDKTLVQIQEQLTRQGIKADASTATNTKNFNTLFHKVDDIKTLLGQPHQPNSDISSFETSEPANVEQFSDHSSPKSQGITDEVRRLTASHKVLLWPCIFDFLQRSRNPVSLDLQAIGRAGTTWFVNLDRTKHFQPLPANDKLTSFVVGRSDRVAFPALPVHRIRVLTDAYFDTFNIILPLLDKDDFLDRTVSTLIANGFGDDDPNAVLAFMVFALGEVATQGIFDPPINQHHVDGKPSGLRGGTSEYPPGLSIYNEARRRLGFVSTQCSLELVQILLLQATYLETSARHLDFWNSTAAASETCEVLITCQTIDWSTPRGDLVKRAYWSCILCEDFYHLELDLPRTSIYSLEANVPWPYSHDGRTQANTADGDNERSYFQYSFLAMIHLRKLITRVHSTIHDCELTAQRPMPNQYDELPVTVIREMARQLENWRSVLPRPLQWSDDHRFDFPDESANDSVRPEEPLFTSEQDSVPVAHSHNLDIATAQLRTRYYYARYLIYRPFIFKALHFPEYMTANDDEQCAMAIESACLWPIALAPPKHKKRLIPHLFTWTQNFISILLILRMTTENECLRAICVKHIQPNIIECTAVLMLEWIHDLRQIDGIAEWAWKLVEPLYGQSSGDENCMDDDDGVA